MKKVIACSAVSTLLLAASQALPCGGGFGQSVTIEPTQSIIVSHHEAVETYVFNPYFCQKADTFGLILPIPTPLTQNPELLDKQVYSDLATVAAPTIETRTVCGEGGRNGVGGSKATGTGGSANSTIVIDKGQVGIFDWALLRATSADSFTAWLTSNGFPYSTSAKAIFDEYVGGAWYFIAFKVSVGSSSTGVGGNGSTSTGSTSISSGQTLCGNFGPISLAFTASTAVIPTRIAAVSSSQLIWTVYALANKRLRIRNQNAELRFAGPIGSDTLTQYESLAAVAQPGDRLTELRSTINPASATDLLLEADPDQSDYRRVETRNVYVTCATGGSTGTGGVRSTTGGYATTGGATPMGGSSVIGGAPTSTGTYVTGGVESVGFGGAGFVLPIGGNSGETGPSSTGGTPLGTSMTGGAPANGSASTTVAAQPRDDGGCSVSRPSDGGHRFFLMLIGAIGLLLRRRRVSTW